MIISGGGGCRSGGSASVVVVDCGCGIRVIAGGGVVYIGIVGTSGVGLL